MVKIMCAYNFITPCMVLILLQVSDMLKSKSIIVSQGQPRSYHSTVKMAQILCFCSSPRSYVSISSHLAFGPFFF